MRIEALHLDRYGAFEGLSLDFREPETRLHVVHGANEAGKSTVLSAIGDLLFGIPARTPYAFRHHYKALLLGAEVSNAAGEALAFKRVKGNSNTLRDAGGERPLPDGALASFLQGVGREAFATMFGLDHARLRAGGEGMLATNGELSRSLFEAGSGLGGAGKALAKLEAEIDAIGDLGGRTAKDKPLFAVLRTYEEAVGTVRKDAVKATAWQEAEDALEKAVSERAAIVADLEALRRERTRCERARRCAPVLAAIDALERRLTEAADVPPLPPDFARAWRDLDLSRRGAEGALERAGTVLGEAGNALADAPSPDPVLDLAGEVEGVIEGLGRFSKDVQDDAKLEGGLAGEDAEILRLGRSLGLADDAEGLGARAPTEVALARVRELAGFGAARNARVEAAEEGLAHEEEALRVARDDLAALPEPRDASAAAELIEVAAGLGAVDADAARAGHERRGAEQALTDALSRLPGWEGSPDDLLARPFPGSEAVREFDERFRAARDRLRVAATALGGAEHEGQEALAHLNALEAEGEVPSREVLQGARERRDRAWALVRARHVDGSDAAQGELDGRAEGGDVASAFEAAVVRADAVSDRREAEAERVALHAGLTRTLARATAERAAAMDEEQRASEALRALREEWERAWGASGLRPDRPSAMLDWLGQRERVVEAIGTARRAREAERRASASVAAARGLLLRAVGPLGVAVASDEGVEPGLREARGALKRAQEATRKHEAATLRAREAERAVASARRSLEKAAAVAGEWRQLWEESVAPLGLPKGAGPAEANAAIEAWSGIRGWAASREQRAKRLSGLRADVEAFRRRVDALRERLDAGSAPARGIAELEAAARALGARLSKARDDAARRELIERAHAAALGARRDAERRADEAREACATFLGAHGLDGHAGDLLGLAARAEEKRGAVADLLAKRNQLAADGEGLSEEELRREVEASPLGDLVATLAALADREATVVTAGQEAAQRETVARRALEELAARRGTQVALQQQHNAARAASDLVRRWVVLTAARAMLERALEKYRQANQHPLVARGGELFAGLAGTGPNPIGGLSVDYDDALRPVLMGVRRDGSRCPVEGMSEGTRDQLFLALRLAAVELHVASGEPMPFVADDVFVTSDEGRTAAGLAALAELGHRTQVILFTHHRHVVDIAKGMRAGLVRVHALDGNAMHAG